MVRGKLFGVAMMLKSARRYLGYTKPRQLCFKTLLSASTHAQATFLHALGKLRMLHGKSRSLDTKKLFAMSVLLLCLTRTMGFMTIGALNMRSVGGDGSSSRRSWQNDADERFYEKTMLVGTMPCLRLVQSPECFTSRAQVFIFA